VDSQGAVESVVRPGPSFVRTVVTAWHTRYADFDQVSIDLRDLATAGAKRDRDDGQAKSTREAAVWKGESSSEKAPTCTGFPCAMY
jgi:hypothetical protein